MEQYQSAWISPQCILSAFKTALEKGMDKTDPTDYILNLLRMVMEKNLLMFNNKTGSQVSPTLCLSLYVSTGGGYVGELS